MPNVHPGVLLALGFCATPSFATTITFTGFPDQFGAFTGSYHESGFVVSVLSGDFDHGVGPLQYYGYVPNPPIPMGTLVGSISSAPATSSEVEIAQSNGQPFLFENFLAARSGFFVPSLEIIGLSSGTEVYSYEPLFGGRHDFSVALNSLYSDIPITSLRLLYSNELPPNYPGYYSTSVTGFAVDPVAATPEPSSFALLGTGLLGVAGVLRRRLA